MYTIFLIIHLVFSTIFYIFGKTEEAIFFLVMGVIFFFAFLPISFKKLFSKTPKSHSIQSSYKEDQEESTTKLQKTYKDFLSSGSYYFAFISFYTAFYWISYSIASILNLRSEELYGVVTLWVAIILMAIYFLFPKKETIARLFYTNTLALSFVLVFLFFIIGIFFKNFSDKYILFNAVFTLCSYPILLFIHAPFKNNRVLIPSFLILLFSFSLYLVVEKLGYSPIGSILFILVFFAIVCFEVLLRFNKLRPIRETGLQNAFLLLLIATPFFFVYHILQGFDWFIGTILWIYTIFLAYIYKRFSLSVAGILSIFSLWYWYLWVFFPGTTPSSYVGYFVFIIIFSFATLPLDRFFSRANKTIETLYGVCIFHFILFSILSYFFFEEFSILWISFLFLWFSSLLFLTYIRFKKV